jgi:NAD+ synthase (glutamine-hydrolysing)
MASLLVSSPSKTFPNYNEFYESRWFRAGSGNEPKQIKYAGYLLPFGIDLIFKYAGTDIGIYAEICEDVWMPIPPSSYAAIGGASILVNLSASNETVAKCEYRTDLVKNQSGRCVAAYAYASAGPSESTTDLVFGGHCLIAENSHLLVQNTQGRRRRQIHSAGQFGVADVSTPKSCWVSAGY